jgi:hypothetical protein
MNLRSQAGLGLLMTALASAAMATPASAAEAPVVVPLHGLEPAIPMDAPTVDTGVPLLMPGAPTVFHEGQTLPDIGLPEVPFTSTLPETDLAAPLPELIDGSRPGTAQLTSPDSPLAAVTPAAEVGSPVGLPDGDRFGLPELTLPNAGLRTAAAKGALEPELGLSQS